MTARKATFSFQAFHQKTKTENKDMKKKTILALASLIALGSAAYAGTCGSCGDKAKKTATPIGMDVVQTAMGSEQFSTLVAAVQAADLVETLQSASNITVFAPSNAAFEALPDGTLEMLLKPENKDTLVSILSYHVLPVEVPSASVESGSVATLEGSPVEISVDDGTVTVDGATVTATDIEASNGVIHVIDQVILPSSVEL